MRRHLTVAEVTAALRRGRTVEQFLGFGEPVDGRPTLAYLWLSGGREVTGRLERCFDDGSPRFLDVGEFQRTDDVTVDWDPFTGPPPDEPQTFSSPEDALEWARSECDASDQQWVNGGVLGAEYRDAMGW